MSVFYRVLHKTSQIPRRSSFAACSENDMRDANTNVFTARLGFGLAPVLPTRPLRTGSADRMLQSISLETKVHFICHTKHYESWVVPAGVPSALADIGGRVEANY